MANVIAYFLWLAICLFFLALFVSGALLRVSIVCMAAFVMLLSFFYLKRTGGSLANLFSLCVVQIFLSLIDIINIILIGKMVSLPVTLELAASIQLSSIIAAGSGFSPGGIGIAEALAAFLSAWSGQMAALGVSLVAINRLLSWVIFLVASFLLAIYQRYRSIG